MTNDEIIKVLLIEDNPGDARLIRVLLAEADSALFHVEVAEYLAAGLAQVDKGDIDVILLDLHLPDSNGLDTLIRAEVRAPGVPIVVLTGLEDEKLGIKAVQEGAQDYLSKGQVNGNLLMRCIRYAIERKRVYDREKELRLKLEEEIERRIEFTRAMVHELRTPLTPILAAGPMLVKQLKQLKQRKEGDLKKLTALVTLAENISLGALNLNSRIDDLLDLARGEVGSLKLKCESIDLLSLLQKVADNTAPMASSNGHSLILDLPPSLPLVQADENRLKQVILNLINNASKFTSRGGTITLRARKNGTALIVEVQDTGDGISEEAQPHIFDPYYQVGSDKQRLSGIGLGLALCKTLVELHSGQIWVESRVGEGSTFSFSLPLEDCQPAPDVVKV